MTATNPMAPEAPDHLINEASIHASLFRMSPIDAELELTSRFGLRQRVIDPCHVHLNRDGDESLALWRDPMKTAEEMRYFSPNDAKAWIELANLIDTAVKIGLPIAMTNITRPGWGVVSKVLLAALGKLRYWGPMFSMMTNTFAGLIEETFEHPMNRAPFATALPFMDFKSDLSAFAMVYLAVLQRYGIAMFEGGTGASPLTSIKHAGSPWEIGLAETHQTLVRERLRSRIVVQVDGGFRTGRDVVIGALLGADEFGFATAPLIAAGCIMMRKCHLNTCPVGVATQDPVLRKRFTGQPEHVINYFFFVAEEVREIMASLGFRTFNEMVGQVQLLDQTKLVAHWKAKGLDFSKLFVKQKEEKGQKIYHSERQNHHLEAVLDRSLIEKAKPSLDRGAPVKIEAAINSTNRSAGAMLSGAVAKIYGHAGLPQDTIHVSLKGTAGQAFGAWLANGVTFELEGEANDYVGKGLSGGKIIVKPPANSGIVPEESIIVGNTVMYGAIQGECYFRGVAGERFAVRNSGAVAVVEGAGDHCCEYMTGGIVVVLGKTGRNFAAGMSGGIAYVLDETGDFGKLCNLSMVELEPVLSEELINAGTYHHSGDLEAHGRVDVFQNLLDSDVERLHVLITRHAKATGSKRAADILANWKEWLPKFRKVMPVEYRRALREMAANADAEPKIAIGA